MPRDSGGTWVRVRGDTLRHGGDPGGPGLEDSVHIIAIERLSAGNGLISARPASRLRRTVEGGTEGG